MKLKPFSTKQRKVLNWWVDNSPVKDYNGIIGDGAIRSGKTVSFWIGFMLWAMTNFNGQNFGLCGKTHMSFRRNVLSFGKQILIDIGYEIYEKRQENLMIVTKGDTFNEFYIFAGNDERSQDLVQGITLAGVFCDEVALMPESFVNQVTSRCSVEGSKFWFNCNPGNPNHFFKKEWIDKQELKRLLYLHFTMDDNLSLAEDIKERYRQQYTGVFYQRYILGKWVIAEGSIYDMFDTNIHCYNDGDLTDLQKKNSDRYIAVDYGTINPCVFLKIYDDGTDVWIDEEYRWDSKKRQRQKTDTEYANDMIAFQNTEDFVTIVDPSAASFKLELRNKGLYVIDGDNDVMNGIRACSSMFNQKHIHINRQKCQGLIEELQSYRWDEKAALVGNERPIKSEDHAPDAMRYYIYTKVPSWRHGIKKES